jgi:hypothetical protein
MFDYRYSSVTYAIECQEAYHDDAQPSISCRISYEAYMYAAAETNAYIAVGH